MSINTIFIDLGDTFRVIRHDDKYTCEARRKIAEILGVKGDAEEFYRDVIVPRYDEYRRWALTYYCEAPEKMLWTRWLAYDFPRETVERNATELTALYRMTKGERVVTDGGAETVKELYKRGYKLGIVSDLVGSREVDIWLDKDGLRKYFKTVQQSSICYIRKPHPAIYFYALEQARSYPGETCFVGDNLERDIVGAKAAGLGMTVGVKYPDKKPQTVTEENRPDCFITHFTQLLDIFPELGKKENAR